MRRADLRPLENHQPGQGKLVIMGWQGPSEGLSLSIQRNQDEQYLQDQGQWGSQPFKFHLPPLQDEDGKHLAAQVGKQLVDPLLADPHATNLIVLFGPDGNQLGSAPLRLGRGLLPSGASGSSPELNASTALDTPQPPTAAPEPAPQPEPKPASEPEAAPVPPVEAPASAPAEPEPTPAQPEPEAPPATKGKRWLWILLAVAILAAIIGAAAWFGLAMRDQTAPPAADEAMVEESLGAEAPEEESLEEESLEEEGPEEQNLEEQSLPEESTPDEPTPTATTAAGPCALQRMGEMGELEFIQACTGAGSEAGNMLEVIGEARDNNHCGIARRLYAHQALNGDVDAALAYAREFDPAEHAASACFPEPDIETAIFWYETALAQDPANAEASLRLEELQ